MSTLFVRGLQRKAAGAVNRQCWNRMFGANAGKECKLFSSSSAAVVSNDEDVGMGDNYIERGEFVSKMVYRAVQDGLVGRDDCPVIDIYNMKLFEDRLLDLQEAFKGVEVNHALAIKSNSIRGILKKAQSMGCGLECASYPEAKHALSLGVEPNKVVFDSPCKTLTELEDVMLAGCYINLDNLQEIEKVNQIMDKLGRDAVKDAQFGLRINPVVGSGTIAASSTATVTSKFGLAWTDETHDDLIQIFRDNDWIRGVHVHVGSQGVAMQKLVAGARRVVEFSDMINDQVGARQINTIDIGGGLPTVYDGVSEAYTFGQYVDYLKEGSPRLLDGTFSLITEFGRSVFVKPGITLSRVEAVKDWCGQQIAVIHVGSNQFLRTAYLPKTWPHVFSVFGPDGTLKTSSDMTPHTIAGPLCFSGDVIGKDMILPKVEVGDYIVIHDTGGYTTALYSKYNSIQASAMYAFHEDDEDDVGRFEMLKERETCEETLAFWGLETPRPVPSKQ